VGESTQLRVAEQECHFRKVDVILFQILERESMAGFLH
jgi:hypothetical protein